MDNRLLFINKREEVISEFLEAYRSEDFQIEVARSGVEAVRKLQVGQYKLVITGLVFPDIDGDKLLHYIKKHAPETKCIVYTTKMNVGQLAFLYNRMQVFRIYLRPGDYKGNMLQGIQEAFEEYDVEKRYVEIHQEEEQSYREQTERYEEIREKVMTEQECDELLTHIITPVLKQVTMLGNALSDDEKQEVLDMEEEILQTYHKESKLPVGGITTIEVKLRHSFFEGTSERGLQIHLPSTVIQLSDAFVDSIYMSIWILVYRMTLLTSSFDCHVTISFETSSRIKVEVKFQLLPGIWEEAQKKVQERRITAVCECMVRSAASGFKREKNELMIGYLLAFDAGRELPFKV
ncbi:MAG: response regulator [Lachnospiraceae bacterium]|nr:response regulator [Lachnospiraceae bacterium]